MGVAKVGDLETRRNGRDGGLGNRVDGSNKGRRQECFVHGRGDGELQQSKCAAAQVQLDGCGI